MKTIHLLRVDRSAAHFAELVAAVQSGGLRVGWLDLENFAPAPASLESAAALGVLRAVAMTPQRVITVKPLRGTPVMKDLLREHFRGCQLVLVLGAVDAPILEPDHENWSVKAPGGSRFEWTTAELVARLRKPRPFS
jgi:hypothetical protein